MRADIHDGPEHNALQAEAGYIDARPYLPDRRNLLQRAAGPYIRVNFYKTRSEHNESAIPLKFSVKADIADQQVRPSADVASASGNLIGLGAARTLEASNDSLELIVGYRQ